MVEDHPSDESREMGRDSDTSTSEIEVKARPDQSIDSGSVRDDGGSSLETTEVLPKSIGTKSSTRIWTSKGRVFLIVTACLVFVVLLILVIVLSVVAQSFNSKADDLEQIDYGDVDHDFSDLKTRVPVPAPPKPSFRHTPLPSVKPDPTGAPSDVPSLLPSISPSKNPSKLPSDVPSLAPSRSLAPTQTQSPTTAAPVTPVNHTSPTFTNFCVIADVPYNLRDERLLPGQIATQMEGCEFLIHLGDIMSGDDDCTIDRYTTVRDMLLESPIPVFVVPGDNEWNDCGDGDAIARGWRFWKNNFLNFENNWNHTFNLVRQENYPENYYMIHKRTLFFGLNIVGGSVHNRNEWAARLGAEAGWVRDVLREHLPFNASGVIIMAHAKALGVHRIFFDVMQTLIQDEWENEFPFMYLHGDGHEFVYTPNYYDQPNYLRIQHEGGVRDPILKIYADPEHLGPSVTDAFQYDQQLHLVT